MDTLAEPILERDKERGHRRSRISATSRTSDAAVAQNQPAHSIDEGEARLSAVCGVASPRRSA